MISVWKMENKESLAFEMTLNVNQTQLCIDQKFVIFILINVGRI